jgi:hypothetical protein
VSHIEYRIDLSLSTHIDTVLFKAEVTYDGSVAAGSIYLLENLLAFGNAYTNEEGST